MSLGLKNNNIQLYLQGVDDVNLITTKHYYLGRRIAKIWKELAARKADKRRKQQQRQLKNQGKGSLVALGSTISDLKTIERLGKKAESNEENDSII